VKYPVLVLTAAIALIAVAPPPPPPPPPGSTTDSATSANAAPSAPTSAQQPAAAPTDDPNGSLNGLFGPKPSASASPGAKANATPSPPPDDRKGLDGVWELQIQRGANTEYEHFNLTQTGSAITGTYLTQDKKKFPLAGSIDGHNVRLVVSLADGSTILLEGRVDGTTDMLGMLTDAQERVPFTAAYRPKEKWSDNVNAQPGGLGSPSGGPPR